MVVSLAVVTSLVGTEISIVLDELVVTVIVLEAFKADVVEIVMTEVDVGTTKLAEDVVVGATELTVLDAFIVVEETKVLEAHANQV